MRWVWERVFVGGTTVNNLSLKTNSESIYVQCGAPARIPATSRWERGTEGGREGQGQREKERERDRERKDEAETSVTETHTEMEPGAIGRPSHIHTRTIRYIA